MLHLLDETLEAFLRDVVPLPARDVDIAFDAPDGEWSAALSTRPTVDLYLWDIRPNLAERDYGEVIVEEADGRRYRRDPLPRVDCRYLVTAWTSEVRDEQEDQQRDRLVVGRVEGDRLAHAEHRGERVLEPLDPAVRDGDAVAEAGRAEPFAREQVVGDGRSGDGVLVFEQQAGVFERALLAGGVDIDHDVDDGQDGGEAVHRNGRPGGESGEPVAEMTG